jgi:predicted metal-dependent peptidase
MTKIERIQIDAATERKWVETRGALMWRCPAFTHILFSMLNPEKGSLAAVFTKDVPYAATDGTNLILNPETFFALPLDERVFIVAHEILHCILNHCSLGFQMRRANRVRYVDGAELPYNQQGMNIAMDLVINDILIHDRIGSFPKMGLHDPKIATRETPFLDAYRKLFEQAKKNGSQPGDGVGGGQGGFDVHLDPGSVQGQDPGQAAQGRNQSAWDTAVAAAVASAKMQGRLPAGLERLLAEVIDPQVSWQDHIRAFFARRVGGGGYNWRKADRRLIQRDIIAPQRAGNGCDTIVVGIDTSGSIGQRVLDTFFGELRGIIGDLQPARVYVVWCDAKVHKVDECENTEDVGGLKPAGGGGTDFRPVFDWIEEEGLQPDALVYLTDGLGAFPDSAPRYPVLWGALKGYNVAYPFGDVVEIEIK